MRLALGGEKVVRLLLDNFAGKIMQDYAHDIYAVTMLVDGL